MFKARVPFMCCGGLFHYDSPLGRISHNKQQHTSRGVFCRWFTPLKIIFERLLALFLTPLEKLGTSANCSVDKREKNCYFKTNNYDDFEA